MLITDCPICDEPASVEATLAAIECAACGVMAVAGDAVQAAELAQAA